MRHQPALTDCHPATKARTRGTACRPGVRALVAGGNGCWFLDASRLSEASGGAGMGAAQQGHASQPDEQQQ